MHKICRSFVWVYMRWAVFLYVWVKVGYMYLRFREGRVTILVIQPINNILLHYTKFPGRRFANNLFNPEKSLTV